MNENTTKGEKMDKGRIAELREIAIAGAICEGEAHELLDALEAALARAEGAEARWNWISVSDALPQDGQKVGFITECARDRWYHGKILGGQYRAGEFGGFSVPGLMVQASHWFPFPPIPETLKPEPRP